MHFISLAVQNVLYAAAASVSIFNFFDVIAIRRVKKKGGKKDNCFKLLVFGYFL